MNEQPKTKEIPTVSAEEIAITQLTRAVETGFREMRADLGLVSNDLGILKDRVGILESHKNDQDTRATRTSQRVRQNSEQDLAHEALLAQTLVALSEEKAKVATLQATSATKDDLQRTTAAQTKALIDELKKDPTVQKAVSAIAAAVATAGTLITAYLATRGH